MPATTFHTLTASSVLSRLDYGNAVLAFLSTCPADSSQWWTRQYTAPLWPASLRPHLRRTHHPPLAPGSGESTVQDGRTCVQVHSWNCESAPSYLSQLVRVANLPRERSLRCARTNRLLVPSVKLSTVRAGPSRSPDLPSGTACRTTCRRDICPVSAWKHFSSGSWSDCITCLDHFRNTWLIDWLKRLPRYGDLMDFAKWRPSAILNLFGTYWVSIIGQNLVQIDTVVSIIWNFHYFAVWLVNAY